MPGCSFRDKALASKAGQKKGKHVKTQQWEKLGAYITGELTDKMIEYIYSLPPKEQFEAYKDLLEYFKPKLQRSEIRAEVSEMREKIKTVFDELQSQPDLPESNQE